jgi:hypothetical protein
MPVDERRDENGQHFRIAAPNQPLSLLLDQHVHQD